MRTKIDSNIARRFGMAELHCVYFQPKDWPGRGPVVSLLIPECEMQLMRLGRGGHPEGVINRPDNSNKDVGHWLDYVCEIAQQTKAAITFSCDTAEQANAAAETAGLTLVDYKRISLEQMGR